MPEIGESLNSLVLCPCPLYLIKAEGKELAGGCRLAVCLKALENVAHHFSSRVDIKSLLTAQLVFTYL